jgi:hypothetical protein
MSSLPSGERRGPAAASPVRHARPRSPHPTRPRTPWRAAVKVPGSIRRGGGLGTPARAGRASRPDNYATAVPGLSIEKSTRYGGSVFGRTQYLGGAAFAADRSCSPPVTRWKQAGSLKSPRPAGPVATCRSHPRRATRQGEAPESIAARRSRALGPSVAPRSGSPAAPASRCRAVPTDRGRPGTGRGPGRAQTAAGRPAAAGRAHARTTRKLDAAWKVTHVREGDSTRPDAGGGRPGTGRRRPGTGRGPSRDAPAQNWK